MPTQKLPYFMSLDTSHTLPERPFCCVLKDEKSDFGTGSTNILKFEIKMNFSKFAASSEDFFKCQRYATHFQKARQNHVISKKALLLMESTTTTIHALGRIASANSTIVRIVHRPIAQAR